MTRRPPLTPEVARRWCYALADVNCWFSGFRAALGDRSVDMPPGCDTLRDIKRWMEDFGEEPEPARIVEAEFPEVAPAPSPPPIINPTGDDVVRRIVIDLVRHSDSDTTAYTVREGETFADRLGWDEMLGVVASRFAPRSGIRLMTLAEHHAAHPSLYADPSDFAEVEPAPAPEKVSGPMNFDPRVGDFTPAVYVCSKCGQETRGRMCNDADCPIPF